MKKKQANKGFFFVEEDNKCYICKLDKKNECITPRMRLSGEGRKKILIIGEAPGLNEDNQGTQFVGEAGKTLRKTLSIYDIDLDRDCWKDNAVACRPPANRPPTSAEIEYCRLRLWKEIKKFEPKIILLLGTAALESFLGHRFPEALGGIHRWRGFAIPDREAQAWVVPTIHPFYVNKSQKEPVVSVIFEQDLDLLSILQDKRFPKYSEKVTFLNTQDEIFSVMSKLFERENLLLAYDFETSGTKPYANGHFIHCMSMCWEEGNAVSFLMPSKDSLEMKAIKRVLRSKRIRKTAHNIKFESIWAEQVLGIKVENEYLCTMLGAHLIDNRQGITGLKFQTYVHFGIIDYSSHMSKWLEADDTGFNRVKEAPIQDLLQYCGMDSLLQYRLARLQEKQLGLLS